jgi:hypothetical protein
VTHKSYSVTQTAVVAWRFGDYLPGGTDAVVLLTSGLGRRGGKFVGNGQIDSLISLFLGRTHSGAGFGRHVSSYGIM